MRQVELEELHTDLGERTLGSHAGESELLTEGEVTPDGASVSPTDPSGMSEEEKLRYVIGPYGFYKSLPDDADREMRASIEVTLASHSVVTILRERGRADYGDPMRLEKISLKPSSPDEFVIAAARARYSFNKGEFPAYDQARERFKQLMNGVDIGDTPTELIQRYEQLYESALQSLGVHTLTSTPDKEGPR